MGSIRPKFCADVMAFHPEITGSFILIVVKYPNGTSTKFIVDCGLIQEKKFVEYNSKLPINAKTLDFVLVTHNHIDHVGRLPLLIKEKYEGNIYMTNATSKLIKLSLKDNLKVLKTISRKNSENILYSEYDINKCFEKIVGCEFEKTLIIDNIKITFLSNGHLLGAAMILVQISYPGYEDINLLFTGDYNNKNMFFDVKPISKFIKGLSLTIIQESTYGYIDSSEVSRCFEKNILKAVEENKTIVVIVSSLGKPQEILYVLKELQRKRKISSRIPIYLDGKLAIKYTRIYLKEDIGIKESMKDFLPNNYHEITDKTRSDLLEDKNMKIILASGNESYGSAQIYISEYMYNEDSLIHFTGYVAKTLTKKKSELKYTSEFSAHAKADEMIKFLKDVSDIAEINLVLVNHGRTCLKIAEKEINVKEIFEERILNEVETKNTGILGREYFFRIDHQGLIKTMNTKFN